MPVALPDRIGPFAVERVLGEGGMGIVYAATAEDGTKVAVKVLRGAVSLSSRSALRRFEQEARIRLDHDNVVRVLGADMDAEGRPYIAFELLVGESLTDRLERAPMTKQEALDVALQAARGLVVAHAAGVVHRDIKPSNLFLCDDGKVKVVDFGIARFVDRETRLTTEGSVVGTAAYFSPEQARGDSVVDGRSDIWSLGVVLYEALAGRNPFARNSVLAVMLAVLSERPRRIDELPAPLWELVETCLAARREDRYPNAAALVRALEELPALEATPAVDATAHTASFEVATSPSIPPGEVRLVVILLATGVTAPERLERAVVERAGSFVSLQGRRAVGVFGGETWEGDELTRAARAALDARPAAAHIAVASGRARYSGDTGIAGSALRIAEAGCEARVTGVAVGAEGAHALTDEFTLTPVDDALFELASSGAAPARDVVATLEHQPMVGRQAEVALLRRAMETAFEEGQAAAVLLTGPPGSGKSHLRRELTRMLVEDTFEAPLVLVARAEPLERDVRLALFRGMLSGHAHDRALSARWPQLGGDAPDDERRRAVNMLVRDALGDTDESREHVPFIGELLGVPVAHDARLEAARRDPRLMADRLRLALIEWLAGLAERGPVALLVEDLQWADDASLDLLEAVLERTAGSALLVLATARPELEERRPGWLTAAGVERIELRGLLRSEVGALVRALTDLEPDAEWVAQLVDRTGGNPLFIEQTLLALEDAEPAERTLAELPVPHSIEAAVQSRLDHLPADEKNLCKRAATLGRRFTEAELVALDVFGAGPLLGSLVRRHVLSTRARGRRGREYGFRSQIVQDVAYGMVEEALRRSLHEQLAHSLATTEGVPLEEVARHFELAGARAEAADWYTRATLAANGRGDADAVVAYAPRAISAGAGEEYRFALHRAHSDALAALGRFDEQEAPLAAALAGAQTTAQRARALTDRAVWLYRAGRSDEALASAHDGEAAARTAGDDEELALALGRRAFVLLYAGQLEEAEAPLAEAEALAASSAPSVLGFAAAWRAQLASARGDHGARRDAYRRAITLYEADGDVRRAAGAELNLADADNRVGAYAEAERALRAVVDKCRRIGTRLWEGYALLNLGYALTKLERHGEALTTLEAAWTLAQQTGDVRLGHFVRVYRARALGARDAPAAADEAEAVAGLTEAAEPLVVLALTVAAQLRHDLGEPEAALALSTRAMALRDRLSGVEEDEADVFLTHARMLAACGRHEEAEATRARGRAVVEAVAAQIGDLEWRRRFLEDVAAHQQLLAG